MVATVDEAGRRQMQEKALMYQLFNAQLEELSSQFLALNQKAMELEAARNALGELGKVPDGSEVLIPVGAGCYGFVKLAKGDKFMVEIGSGLVEEKPLAGAIEAVEERKKEIVKLQEMARNEIEGLRGRMDQIGLELNESAAAARGMGGMKVASPGENESKEDAVARVAKARPKKSKEDDDDEVMVE
jgi:prefoldin alpha subunit